MPAPVPETAPSLPPGFELRTPRHAFRIISKIASGGFGITYKVQNTKEFVIPHTRLVVPVGTVLALKECFKKDYMVRDASGFARPRSGFESQVRLLREQFLNEAITLVGLHAKAPVERRAQAGLLGYVPAFHAGTATKRTYESNVHYFVMPFLTGGSLAQYVGKMHPSYVVRVAYRLLRALQLLHNDANGNHTPLLHCDIKPSNIMLTAKSEPVFIDFGISSGTETMGGTLDFSPHEQIGTIRQPLGPHSDLYALGATLYMLITGSCVPRYNMRPPYTKTDAYVPLHLQPIWVERFKECGAEFEHSYRVCKNRAYEGRCGDFATTFLWGIDMALRASAPCSARWLNSSAWLDAVFCGLSPLTTPEDARSNSQWNVGGGDAKNSDAPIPQPVPQPIPQPVPQPIPQPVPQPAPTPSALTTVLVGLVLVLVVVLVGIICANSQLFGF